MNTSYVLATYMKCGQTAKLTPTALKTHGLKSDAPIASFVKRLAASGAAVIAC
jgi:hypothetical protein